MYALNHGRGKAID